MNLYLHELKSYRKFTIIWTSSLIVLFLLYFSIYPTILNDADAFINMLKNYPQEVQKMFGFSLDSITSVLGFYAFILNFVSLCAGIQAMNLGLGIISKETKEKTVDFLLTKPISRIKILISKISAGATTLLFTNICFLIITKLAISIMTTKTYQSEVFLYMTFGLLFTQIMFYVIGILISVVLPKIKSVLPISLGVIFISFFVGNFLVNDVNDKLRFMTPFKYFDANFIYLNFYEKSDVSHIFEWGYLIGAFVIVIISLLASILIYQAKDIHSV